MAGDDVPVSKAASPELEVVIRNVKAAGKLILTYFQRQYSIREKSRDNPVTSADLAADAYLREAFAREFPHDGWLSEETADSAARLTRKRVWVVDPLDGTKEFVKGLPEFAVSVALVQDAEPRLGVVYNPVRDDLFAAEFGHGAFHQGSRLRISNCKELQNARLLSSRAESTVRLLGSLQRHCSLQTIGSTAYKLALVAAQEGDLTISLHPKNEWDVCAGTLLVSEAGGVVSDLRGAKLQFNKKDPLVDGIIAGNALLHRLALEWIRQNVEI